MNDVNWWLMAAAFLLGLLLTLAFMVRRIKREVPVYESLGRGQGIDVEAPKVSKAGAGAAAAGIAAATGAAAKLAGDRSADEPYGEGSARVAAGAAAPTGWTVKGNEDSMLYHTPESPSYKQTIAELWFRDEASAVRAGFARWDSGKSQRGRT